MRVNSSERAVRGVKKAFVAMSGALVCLALLAGCADKPTYDVDYDQSFPFAEYKTYRWYDDDHNSRESQYRRYNSSDQRVRNTADQELMQRGLRQGARGQADFWVNYHVTKRQLNDRRYSEINATINKVTLAGLGGSSVPAGTTPRSICACRASFRTASQPWSNWPLYFSIHS